MVQICMTKYLDAMPTREEKFKLLETLREASEGKIFLEREYSQCTRMLCDMLEQDGKVDEATKIIQEIQIETYGTIEVKEKVDFILHQMKLVLMRNDFVRCQIMSRKVSRRHLNEKGLEGQKIQYYTYMIRYYIHEKMHIDVAKSY
jgi:26S proteasome regulatory subunit N5